MAAKGIAVETFSERIEAVRCTAVIAGALGVEEGTQVVLLDRVRGYDGEPAVWFRSWFHPRLGLDERSTFDGPLYEYLERVAGVVATSSREELGAAACDERTAGRLNSAVGVPVMVRRRTVTDRSGRPIEYADNRYRSDRFTYTLEMQRMGVGG